MRRAALLALLAFSGTNAFAPLTGQRHGKTALWATKEAIDVSVPYDAACRLAYDAWREQYQKGDFDDRRYQSFKTNYEAITVANVSAKKVAREKEEEPRLLSLNEYGDYSEEEYASVQNSGKSATTTGNVLGKAVEAVQSQSAASTALGDAAAALAEEEEKLAKKLGYDSVEELEVAMDTMEGIAEDGSDIVDGLAREARIRSAYLEWCKENGKEPNEARFPTFSSNFLAMEEYAKESGKEMTLNQYADCSEDEYLAATSAAAVVDAKSTAEAAIAEAEAAIGKVDAEKRQKEESKAEAEAKRQADIAATAKKEAEAKERKEAEVKASLSSAEERATRQAAQAKAQAQLAAENEAAAIAAAKKIAEREASQVAQRRAIDAKAAEIVRQKAQKFEEKQKALAKKQADASQKAASKTRAPKIELPSLGSMFKAPAPTTKKETPRIEVELPDLGAVFRAPAPAPKKVTPKSDLPSLGSVFQAPTPAPKKEAPKIDLGSIFSSPASALKPTAKKPVAKKPVVSVQISKPVVAKKPAAKKPVVSTPNPKLVKDVSVSVSVTDAFSSFFGSKAVPTPKVAPKPAPTITPVPKSKKEPFSFFGGAQPKRKPKPEPVPRRDSVPKPAFSFFGSPPPAPKPAPEPVSLPAPKPFSFLGSPAAKKVAPAPAPAPTPAPKPFSFLGSPAAKKVAPAPAPAPTPALKPSFTIFGGRPAGNTLVKKAEKMAPALKSRGTIAIPKTAKSNNFGFAFGGGPIKKEAETQDDIPVLSQFSQNADGSLTGKISNSKNFKNGTKITTSPVPRGAKAGRVVKTSSGSQYRLK